MMLNTAFGFPVRQMTIPVFVVHFSQCSWGIKLPEDSSLHGWNFAWGLRDLRGAVAGKQGEHSALCPSQRESEAS